MERKIFGVSSKYNFGRWEHGIYVFDTKEEAQNWLHEEGYDFRERELMSKTKAIKLAGKPAVDNALEQYQLEKLYSNWLNEYTK